MDWDVPSDIIQGIEIYLFICKLIAKLFVAQNSLSRLGFPFLIQVLAVGTRGEVAKLN